MPATTTFTGIGISLQSVTPQTNGSSLLVRFTTVPLQVSPLGANDALNPANYALTGPGSAAISSVSSVATDSQSVAIAFSSPLAAGTWILTVTNIQTPGAVGLIPPTSMTFLVTVSANATSLAAGASNDDAEKIIRKHLSQGMAGDNWNALIAGLASGDDANWTNAELAFDQLFEISASGAYLDRLGSNRGIVRPPDVGLSDDLYRQLLIALNSNKLTHEALREILAIFYGQDALRAWAETSLEEPFALKDGSTLTWELDEDTDLSTTFSAEQFTQIEAATALEVASILTKAMADAGTFGYAAAVVNPITGGKRVRIYSGSLGLKSFVRITGGTAQPFVRFPLYKEVYSGTVTSGLGYNWSYSNPSQGVTRISLTTVGQPLIDISSIQAGDYVVIGPNINVASGSYSITAVDYSWSGTSLTQSFDLDVDLGFVGSTLQIGNDDYRFFNPQKQTILNGSRTVVVAQVQPGQVDIQIPATTQAVSRGPRIAAYGRDNATTLAVESYIRDTDGTVTLNLSESLGSPLAANSQIFLEGFRPALSRPWTSPGVPGTYPAVATANASYGTCWTSTQTPPSANKHFSRMVALQNDDILITGGLSFSGGVTAGESAKANRFRLASTTTTVNDGSEADGASRFSYQWIATADMNTARLEHAQSLLADGRVLVTGGQSSTGSGIVFNVITAKNSPEIYSPSTNTWTNVAAMSMKRTGHQQVTMNNNKVIVIGGAFNMGTATNTTEIFDPSTGVWSAGASMSIPRYQHKAVALSDGRIFVTGGRTLGQTMATPNTCLAYWTMDDSSNPTFVNDLVGSWPLAVHGSPTIIDGKVNSARDFTVSGSWADENGYLNDPTAISLLTGEWTIEFWLPAGSGTDGVLFAYGGPTGVLADNLLFEVGLAGGAIYWKWQYGAGVNVTATATTTLAGWQYVGTFIAVRKKFNGTNYDVSWFLNGVVMDTWTNQTNCAGGTNAQWFICADPKTSPVVNGGSRAILDEARISNVALLDSDILNDYYTTSGWVGFLWDIENVEGVATDRTAFYTPGTNTWTEGPKMQFGRALHNMHLLPDGKVLVYGGYGRDLTTELPPQHQDEVTTWPNLSGVTMSAEYWDPNTNRWYATEAPSQLYVDACSVYLPTSNQIIVTNPRNTAQSIDYSQIGVYTNSIPFRVEAFDCTNKTWKVLPIQNTSDQYLSTTYGIHAGSDVVLITGGVNGSLVPYPNATLLTPGATQFVGGGLNGLHSVVSSTTGSITISTPSYPFFSTNFGDAGYQGGQVFDTTNWTYNDLYTNYTYQISNFVRSSNVATLTLNTTAGLSVGQSVYVNINTNVPMGIKTLTAVTPTTISYVDTGTDIGSTPTTGVVDINQNPNAAIRIGAVATQPSTDPGPYIFDPKLGLSVLSTATTLQTAILTGQQVGTLTVADNSAFPNAEGYLVIDFGMSTQSSPIRYLGKFGTNMLIVDFSYVAEHDFTVGSTVTLLQGRNPFVPAIPLDSANFYITGSTIGRIAAQNFLAGAAATGITLSIDVVYPGDRGLGAEGYPTENASKLSDVVRMFGGDNLDEEGL